MMDVTLNDVVQLATSGGRGGCKVTSLSVNEDGLEAVLVDASGREYMLQLQPLVKCQIDQAV